MMHVKDAVNFLFLKKEDVSKDNLWDNLVLALMTKDLIPGNIEFSQIFKSVVFTMKSVERGSDVSDKDFDKGLKLLEQIHSLLLRKLRIADPLDNMSRTEISTLLGEAKDKLAEYTTKLEAETLTREEYQELVKFIVLISVSVKRKVDTLIVTILRWGSERENEFSPLGSNMLGGILLGAYNEFIGFERNKEAEERLMVEAVLEENLRRSQAFTASSQEIDKDTLVSYIGKLLTDVGEGKDLRFTLDDFIHKLKAIGY